MTVSPQLIRRLRAQAAIHGRKKRKRPPRWFFPATAERKYIAEVRAAIERIRKLFEQMVLPRLPALAAQAKQAQPIPDSARADGWPEALAQLLVDFRITVERDEASRRRNIQQLAAEISGWNKSQWRKVVSATIGIDIIGAEPWLQDQITGWVGENASLITSLEQNAIGDVETWTARGLRNGQRHEEIAAKIADRFGVSESKAEFIARDQTAKLNGNLTQARQTSLGVKSYTWRTVGDDRVRPTHAAHDGKTYDWDSPPANTGHPGQDFQCRCDAEPNLSGLLAALDEVE